MADSPSLTLSWFANRANALRIESVASGAPLNVSTWTWAGQLRSSVDGTPVITMAVDMSEAATGAVTLSVSAAQTVGLEDQVWSLGVDVTIAGAKSQLVKTNTVRFEEPVEP